MRNAVTGLLPDSIVGSIRQTAKALRFRLLSLEPGSIALAPDEQKNSVDVRLPGPPYRHTYLVKFDTGEELRLAGRERMFQWQIHGRHCDDSNVAFIHAVSLEGESPQKIGEIEVLRQNETHLLESFDFKQSSGYLVIGRNTFAKKSTITASAPNHGK